MPLCLSTISYPIHARSRNNFEIYNNYKIQLFIQSFIFLFGFLVHSIMRCSHRFCVCLFNKLDILYVLVCLNVYVFVYACVFGYYFLPIN